MGPSKSLLASITCVSLFISYALHSASPSTQATPVKKRYSSAVKLTKNEQELFKAVGKKDINSVVRLLDSGTKVDIINAQGDTPLMLAAFFGLDDVARLLIKKGANVNKSISYCHEQVKRSHWGPEHLTSCENNSPLRYAVMGNHPKVVRLLLDNSANPDGPARDDTALHEALLRKHLAIAKILIDHGANVNAYSKRFHNYPLEMSLQTESRSFIEMLIDKGANPFPTDKSKPPGTAIGTLACNKYLDRQWSLGVFRMIMDKRKDINLGEYNYTYDDKPILFCAILNKDLEVIQLLLDHGADPASRDSKGHDSYWLSVSMFDKSKSADILELLLKKKAEKESIQKLLAETHGSSGMEQVNKLLLRYANTPILDCQPITAKLDLKRFGSHVNKPRKYKGITYPTASYTLITDNDLSAYDDYNISPDGEWLVYNKSINKKTILGVVNLYNYSASVIDRDHRLRREYNGWTKDSRFIAFHHDRERLLYDFSSATPVLNKNYTLDQIRDMDFDYRGGQPCRSRDKNGKVVPTRLRDSNSYAWSPDGKTLYEVEVSRNGDHLLVARKRKNKKVLAILRLEDETNAMLKELGKGDTAYEKKLLADMRKQLKDQYRKADLSKARFRYNIYLSPSGRYLYYEIGSHGWFANTIQGIVIDTRNPANRWAIKNATGDKNDFLKHVNWHPNGRDLFFIARKSKAGSNNAKNHRLRSQQLYTSHIAVARFP